MTYHTTIVDYARQGYGVDDIVVLMRRRRKEFPNTISREQIKYWVWQVHKGGDIEHQKADHRTRIGRV